ncbi:MAG: helix-turn-helix transcriptional regulator [Candidatus Diapherotrites archaeon]|nr:helix-turn-helix transcriptional regulator [Candidatus Diapherotrites archaeon]
MPRAPVERTMPSLRRFQFQIVVRRVEKPFDKDLQKELNWICESLGFFEPIDKDKTAAGVFKEIVLATEKGTGITSSQLAHQVKMSRGSVINHLNNLLQAGLVIKQGRAYFARSKSMVRTLREVEEEVQRVFDRMEQTAREIDKRFGMEIED